METLRRWLRVFVDWSASPWLRPDSAAAWAVAAALVLAGFIAKPLLDAAVGEPLPPFITFYASVTIAALLGGPRIGLAVTAVTVLLTWYFFMPPFNSFALTSSRTVFSLVIYLVLSSFLAWIVGKSRLVQDSLIESELRRDRAARESVHRIKNLIAVIQAIATKLSREVHTVPEYRNVLSARLVALGSAQDMLVQSGWSDVDLAELIKSALAPFLPNPGFDLRPGPDAKVPARHVGGLSMALYELCTNSMKYGALAEGLGPVVLSWRKENGGVMLEWIETAPSAPTRDEGLGTQLIRYALGNDSGCVVHYAVNGTAITALFRWPADAK
ncbi:sensor histidine kinase [Rhizomicrobium electricum]|uniref:histidine kinase n=1 Tax=Rhizomicrobium electricum TaxID=480070 RepID=A0ABN1EKH8_9PROT|nr:HWE histidine kinase domain-containing protein [Rhizomicrobium electricum]NIJ47111.1 two-component sensor histidine kinase [Rhizomicrobium electricum]